MTDTSTADEASTDEQDPLEEQRRKITEAVLTELREVFESNFGRDFDEAQFVIAQDEDEQTRDEGPWTIRLKGRSSVDEEPTLSEGRHELFLESGDDENSESEKINLKVEGNLEDGEVEIHIKRAKSTRWAKFNMLTVRPTDPEEYGGGYEKILTDRAVYPRYKNISQSVLEVWFPSDDEDEGVLETPIHLESYPRYIGSEEFSEKWGNFTGDGFEVPIPDLELKRVEDEFDAKVVSGEEWRHVGLSFLMYWVVCNVYAGNGTPRQDDDNHIPDGFPELKKYRAKRPVNLEPDSVLEDLKDDGLYFPWHVIESACSALNAGKNVIFTGPPGGGKSKLASFLAEKATGQDPLMTTASPAWSTGDLIGRYMPDREGHGLVFQEGVFLRALGNTNERPRWLVIDEFNRADIDACFGELFSVLAGDAVELPFKKEMQDGDEAPSGKSGGLHPVRIAPEGENTETEFDYLVPDTFRLIGTMNDADRSGLNNLSFALMRRFAIIPVEAPDESDVRDIVEEYIEETEKDLQLESTAWNVSERGTKRCRLGAEKESESTEDDGNGYDGSIEDELKFLFAVDDSKTEQEFSNLVSDGVVGVSVIGDVIRFVGEGIRFGKEKHKLKKDDELWDDIGGRRKIGKLAENLTLSYLALATVLQIFPQLEALGMGADREQDTLRQAIRHIFEAFQVGKTYDPLLMLRVRREDDKYILESRDTIAEFLFENLQTRFPQQAKDWRGDLDEYFSNGNGSDE
jgi:hypothetical protein